MRCVSACTTPYSAFRYSPRLSLGAYLLMLLSVQMQATSGRLTTVLAPPLHCIFSDNLL